MSSDIDIAKYLARLEAYGMQHPLNAIQSCISDLAHEINSIIKLKENVNLRIVNGQIPLLEINCTEILMWSIAILSSAWTEWVFAAKSNNPDYKSHPDKSSPTVNAIVCYPYIRKSITNAMSKASEIGNNAESEFRPEKIIARFELQKASTN
jgi:hypothetical protein